MTIPRLPTVARLASLRIFLAIRLTVCWAAMWCGLRSASADIILSLSGAPTALSGGTYSYTYSVTLAGGQIDPVGSTDRNGDVVSTQFGTFYDFGPVVTNSGGTNYTATGLLGQYFSFTFSNTSTPASQTTPNDSASLLNVRLTYNNTSRGTADPNNTTLAAGSYFVVDSSLTGNLGTFTVISPYGPALNTQRSYDGQSYKGTNNTLISNAGSVSGPNIPAAPEPSTWTLLGVGAVGACAVALRRRQVVRG